jgi:hypothetical protein
LFPHSIFNSTSLDHSRILYSSIPLVPAFYIHRPVSRWFPHSIFISPSPDRSRILYSSIPLVPAFYIHRPVYRLSPHSLFNIPSATSSRTLYSSAKSSLFPHSIFISPSHAGSRILYLSSRLPLFPAFYIHMPGSRLFPQSLFNKLELLLFTHFLFNSPSAAGSSPCDATLIFTKVGNRDSVYRELYSRILEREAFSSPASRLLEVLPGRMVSKLLHQQEYPLRTLRRM